MRKLWSAANRIKRPSVTIHNEPGLLAMICLLNFCHKDRDQALNLLKWIGTLGGCKGHDLILQSSITAAANGLVSELELAANELFDTVTTRVTDIQDERGWPYSCNTAWVDAVMFMRYRPARPWLFAKMENPAGTPKWKEEVAEASKRLTVPWFWMEPDCVPLTKDWLDRIEVAYRECSVRKSQPKYFLGGEVRQPEHRMSGVGVYPCAVAQFTRGLPHLANNPAPWDQVLAQDFSSFVEYTPLIQNVWNKTVGDPNSAPTFPDVASLAYLDPNAVLFHRCKDGSLIERLRENEAAEIPVLSEKEMISEIVKFDNQKQREKELLEEIARLKAEQIEASRRILSTKMIAPKKHGKHMKQRTPERIAVDKARMAKVRAARLAKA